MTQYCIEVTIAWTMFYSIYLIFLKRETFFSVNRWYLIHTTWIGALIPLLSYISLPLAQDQALIMEPVQIIHYTTYAVSEAMNSTQEEGIVNLKSILISLYILGVILFTMRFIYGLRSIYRLWRSGEKVDNEGFTLVLSDKYHLPFSFLNCVYLHRSFLENESIREILDHEMVHVQSRHTLDVLFLEVLSIVFWWNPIIYLYQRELRQTHEYVADAYASQHTYKRNYGHILLGPCSSGIEHGLTNQFFNSHLKKRIAMLYKKKSAYYKLSKYLLVIPVLFFLCVLYSFQDQTMDFEQPQIIESPIEEIILNSAIPDNIAADIDNGQVPVMKPMIASVAGEKDEDSQQLHSCDRIKGTDVHYGPGISPILESCKDLATFEEQKECTRHRLSEMMVEKISYNESAIREGYQTFNAWSVRVGSDGKIFDVVASYPRMDENSYGMKEQALEIIELWKNDLQFIPAKCNGEPVKGLTHLTYSLKLSDEQLEMVEQKDSYNTKKIFQNIYFAAMTPEGNLSFFINSNFNTPTNVKVYDPNNVEIYNQDLSYYYKKTHGSVTIPTKVNGTYTAVMSQDGKEVKATMPVTIF